MKKFKTIIITIILITLTNQIIYAATLGVNYQAHVQNYGWQAWQSNGSIAGTINESLRVEALKINLENTVSEMDVEYRVHIQNLGWQEWKKSGEIAGTVGQELRIEAIEIKLNNADEYHVRYKAHVQNYGWQDWVYDGALAGTIGKGLRLEAIQIEIVDKFENNIINYVSAKDIAERIDSRTREEFKNVVNKDEELLAFYNSDQIEQINQINLESDNFKNNKMELSGLQTSAIESDIARLSLTGSLSNVNNQLINIGIPASLRYGILAEVAAIMAAIADGPLPWGDIAAIAVSIGVGFIIISNWDIIENKGAQIGEILRNEYRKISIEVSNKVETAVSYSFELIENAAEESERSLPLVGKPNSTKERVKDGKVVQRRHYDENGKARVDEDFSDHGTPSLHSNPHYHEWDWSTGKPKRGKTINWFD